MIDMARRFAWFSIVSCAIAYAIFLVVGTVIHTQVVDESRIVLIRDRLAPNTHHLSGMIMVPRTCTELSVRTEQVSEYTYQLLFRTWEAPSVRCEEEEVPRSFNSTVFAPAVGVRFLATLDGTPIPIVVIRAPRD